MNSFISNLMRKLFSPLNLQWIPKGVPILMIPVFACIVVLTNAQADAFVPMKDRASFEKKIQEKAQTVKTLQSEFTQEKKLSFLTSTILSKGQFFYRNDDKVRWEYTSPYPYLILIKNREITISDEGHVNKIDMATNKTFKEINEMVVGSIQGKIIDTVHFKNRYSENNSLFRVAMEPMDPKMKKFIKEIVIDFSRTDLNIKAVKIVELSEDFTQITFSKTQYNLVIGDEKFNLH